MMNKELPHLRKAIYGQPWAITDTWLDAICDIFEANVSGANPKAFEAAAHDLFDDEGRDYQVVDGVAIIPVMGPIFPRANILTKMSGATSLDVFTRRLDDAINDDGAMAVMIHIDSPGGSVMGLAEAATKVFNARGGKPIVSLAEGTAASAAYMIGSQADYFYATEGSVIGSIGTIARIDSQDRAMKNAGVDSVIFRSSELKAAGNGPMTPRQEDSMRKMLQTFFAMFKDAVLRGREGIDIEAVATGEVWIGSEAVDLNLIDGIMTFDDVIREWSGSAIAEMV